MNRPSGRISPIPTATRRLTNTYFGAAVSVPNDGRSDRGNWIENRRAAGGAVALDLEVGTLALRESVYEGSSSDQKTHKSRRTIPLGPHAITSLKEHRDRSTRKSDDDLVFPNKFGEPLRESTLLERVLQPAAERAGLQRVTWHQFKQSDGQLVSEREGMASSRGSPTRARARVGKRERRLEAPP